MTIQGTVRWAGGPLAIAMLVAGCGDPLADTGFRGLPIVTLSGYVDDGSAVGELRGLPDLALALFWSPEGAYVTDLERHVEQVSTATPVTVPGPFVINVFERPRAEHRVRSPDGDGDLGYAVGRLVAYQDLDHDGRRGAGEPFWGLEGPIAFFHAAAPVAAGRSPTGGALPDGFHALLVPQRCGAAVPPATTTGDCGVPLGAACATDDACQGGACLESESVLWPSGACALPEPPTIACRPGAAAFYPARQAGSGRTGYYLKPCAADADCTRKTDIDPNAYRCDPGLGACTPNEPLLVKVARSFTVPAICLSP